MKSMRLVASLAMLLATLLAVAPSRSGATVKARGVCTVKGNLEWTRSGDDYAVRLVIPLNRSDSSPHDCVDSGEITGYTCGPIDPCTRRVDTLFGTLEGTVGRLGMCDHRPAEQGHATNSLYGLHLQGRIYFYRADLRRLYLPGHDLELVQTNQANETVFPGELPIRGKVFMDGNGPWNPEPSLGDRTFGLGNDFTMMSRIHGTCPSGGDPRAWTTLTFGITDIIPSFPGL